VQTWLRAPLYLPVAFAEICGAHGAKLVSSDALNVALRRVPDVDGPARVQIMTDTDLVLNHGQGGGLFRLDPL